MSGIADEDHLEWDDAASQEWFEIVESWRWERREGDWVKQGACPRCGHSMDRTFAGGIAFALPQLPDPSPSGATAALHTQIAQMDATAGAARAHA